jgi:hypothetical protein
MGLMIVNQSKTYSNDTSWTNMLPISRMYKRCMITTVNGHYRVGSFDRRETFGDFGTMSEAMDFIDIKKPNIPNGMDGMDGGTKAVLGIGLFLAVGHYLTRAK